MAVLCHTLSPQPVGTIERLLLASIGNGYRTVIDLLCEISLHLVEPIVQSTLTAPITTPLGLKTVTVDTTTAMYPGAQVVVDIGTPREIVTIIEVTSAVSFKAAFRKEHAAGVQILGATFPTQQPFLTGSLPVVGGNAYDEGGYDEGPYGGGPPTPGATSIFTQREMLSYLARAQNEFLTRVPCVFGMSQQTLTYGQIFQSTPSTAIEMERVAVSTRDTAIVSLVRQNQVVTAITATPHGLTAGSKFAVIDSTLSPIVALTGYGEGGYGGGGYGGGDPTVVAGTFPGVFLVTSVVGSTGYGQGGYGSGGYGGGDQNSLSFTYRQVAPNGAVSGGVIGLWKRLYETSQESLTMQTRTWRNDSSTALKSWFEDRAGNYGWGVGSKPSSNFPAELLYSIRDDDVLGWTDGFLVPDLLIHIVKYKALEFALSKDGVNQQPQMAKWCAMRFERGVLATQRWMDNMLNATGMMTMSTGSGGGGGRR